jgi:histidinol phosphatase-like enzyme (inositol monophosphatase family)
VDWTHYSAVLQEQEEAEFVPFLHELIGCAFAIIEPLFLADIAVQRKSDATPVTAADRGAEAAMRRRIEARYPEHAILGEEFGVRAGTRYRWILDPVDGTKAFVSNCFLFGTLIALERDDGAGYRPVLGCIAHAAAGMALIGHRGRTTLFRRDGSQRPVRVRPARPLAQATVLTTSLPGSPEQGAHAAVGRITRSAALARTWGDCFGYFSLATGGADAMLDPELSYWDVAAVVPVVEGAGGRVTSWRGGDPLRDPSLIATSGALHEEILAEIGAPHGPSPA